MPKKQESFAANKRAFDDVMGDPFAVPEPIEGHYNMLRSRSSIPAMQTNFDEGKATPNPARPNKLDFICDVENVISDVITEKSVLKKFIRTYVYEDKSQITQVERTILEQRIGRLFRFRGISPVTKYFTTIRRPVKGDSAGK